MTLIKPKTMTAQPAKTLNRNQILACANKVIAEEAHEVARLHELINDHFIHAVTLMLETCGRVIVLGMGKSGHIGRKIAATLASTGTPSFFIHPAEASHGDLGMITAQDSILLLSYSGKTRELVELLPSLKRLNVPIVAITGDNQSILAKQANHALTLNIKKEACPLNLAPTSSSTAMLALGDAIAIALLQAKGFNQENFATVHPGGSLGNQWLTIADLMHNKPQLPTIPLQATLADAILETTQQGFGVSFIVDQTNKLLGVFTDGDLRRAMNQELLATSTPIANIMTTEAISASPELLAAQAVTLMEQHKITALPIVDSKQHLIGILHMHDLLKAKII